MTVTFFGHRDTPQDVYPLLEKAIKELIEEKNSTMFYVGNNGNFDYMVRNVLKRVKISYPYIQYNVVLAYKPMVVNYMDTDVIFPDCLSSATPTAAIPCRNMWMLERSDLIVAYVNRKSNGAGRFCHIAEYKNKEVINLAEYKG